MSGAGLRVPAFRKLRIESDPSEAAALVDFPCVLKPLGLSASRGVIRADDPDAFVAAFRSVVSILEGADVRHKGSDTEHLLVEDYWPGREVALEGLLESGTLRVLALFDKPDPLEGPTFEETIYVTPSRLPDEIRPAVDREVAEGCRALGLSEGPVHAELRVHDGHPWLIEVAARTIGGLCSRALRFGAGITLEELVLRHALGRPARDESREKRASGVMMIPIPRAGILREVRGLESARASALIEEVTITMHRGARLEPLPRGDRYLGFIFARGDDPADVERALRDAHGRLTAEIEE
jgi:biotin carboxylase